MKRQKNDAADAEAIVTAARQPDMRFVELKGVEQQARAVLFRARERIVHQRTELVNALRAVLYEFGHIVPLGIGYIPRIKQIVEDDRVGLPEIVREECHDLLAQIGEKAARIEMKTKKLAELSKQSHAARRLQTMPGVGPMTAVAIEAFAPPMETFQCGRNFASWLGLVPRQHSTGGKARLGRVSKSGQSDIRRLLIIGAMSRLTQRGQKGIAKRSWLARLIATGKPRMLIAIALANKMARQVWAMITKEEDYQHPSLVGVA